MNNQEWQTGIPEKDGFYLVSLFNIETNAHFYSTSSVLDGRWLHQYPYIVTGYMLLPGLPKAPSNLPIVEKITWYPFAIWPEKQGTYLVKGTEPDGVTIYDKLFYDGARWPENDFTFWAKQD